MHYSLFAIVPFPKGCRIKTKMVGQDSIIEDVFFQDASYQHYKGYDLLSYKGKTVAEFSENGEKTAELRHTIDVNSLNFHLSQKECFIRLRKIQ